MEARHAEKEIRIVLGLQSKSAIWFFFVTIAFLSYLKICWTGFYWVHTIVSYDSVYNGRSCG